MKRNWQLPCLAVMAAACAATPAWAQKDATPATPATPASNATSDTPAVEPSAIHAIELMAQKLRTLKSFTVTADVTNEDVLDSGQKVTYGGIVTYKVRSPDRFFASVDSDRKQRSFYYDGSKFTVYAPRMHYYAQRPLANTTVAQLVSTAQEKYDIDMPLADLFYWGTDKAPTSTIQSATVIGPARVGKIECDHLLMRQSGVDWQVWISRQTMLPAKLVIANLDDPTQPEYSATLQWDTESSLADSIFTFSPTSADHLIKISDDAQTKEASP
ncbi:MAG TPA: DUF2092 domain-containing protein [Dyella sp.]|uniref:DUF2092 domain-containing protein n=1 Tax=Dyella sp. TaxID=1869338 RepID=UPI002D770896|nr:DUF2092 domain-containing protein [Dyella sp.]HET6555340.1 DUF2092 domain-containing protein [Dyella sp.]